MADIVSLDELRKAKQTAVLSEVPQEQKSNAQSEPNLVDTEQLMAVMPLALFQEIQAALMFYTSRGEKVSVVDNGKRARKALDAIITASHGEQIAIMQLQQNQS